ncbi:hypothetical protein [Clostridium pasteurianum]|uniref:hypothetical protein n=1 Tax=Clostridium pasteurianum TaxID=1501 RepID=UPI00059F3946|nr:hypothetical protein [Clostridium pasteurianum]
MPCIRFNVHYIEKIEGRISEKVTLRERKLEREIEYAVSKANVILSEVLYNTLKKFSIELFTISIQYCHRIAINKN